MKIVLFLLTCCLQQILSNASYAAFLGLNLGPECMSLSQIYKTTKTMCKQRSNRAWWDAVIKCHRPMTDEFMRASGEAQCPIPKQVQQPNNTDSSIEDVFYNICGIVEGNWWQFAQTAYCVVFGGSDPYIMTHREEVRIVKETWGAGLPCQIGKCILDLGIPMEDEEEEEEE